MQRVIWVVSYRCAVVPLPGVIAPLFAMWTGSGGRGFGEGTVIGMPNKPIPQQPLPAPFSSDIDVAGGKSTGLRRPCISQTGLHSALSSSRMAGILLTSSSSIGAASFSASPSSFSAPVKSMEKMASPNPTRKDIHFQTSPIFSYSPKRIIPLHEPMQINVEAYIGMAFEASYVASDKFRDHNWPAAKGHSISTTNQKDKVINGLSPCGASAISIMTLKCENVREAQKPGSNIPQVRSNFGQFTPVHLAIVLRGKKRNIMMHVKIIINPPK